MTPQAILNRPILISVENEIAKAYDILSSSRTVGIGIGPIQLSEITAFVQLYGEPSVPIDIFIELISSMDAKYLELKGGHKHSSNSAN